jgi:uncharacterized protein
MDPRELDLSNLWALATHQFALGRQSIHGSDHWQRVERNGLQISEQSGADVLIVRLFAVLHDSQRRNESHDPQHGARAAAWARQLNGTELHLPPENLEILCEAMIWHDKGRTSSHPTIGTCWDADRLDLPRVGIIPATRFMSTGYGKELAAQRG